MHGFKPFFLVFLAFLHDFVLAKLATSSKRVKMQMGQERKRERERVDFLPEF